MKMSSFNMFKSSENIQKEEGGPDRTVLDNQSSSVTLSSANKGADLHLCQSRFSHDAARL